MPFPAYLGDGNYVGSTNTLNQIVTNHPPVANVMTVTRTAGLALMIALSDVAINWTDNPDGDSVSLTGVTMQSTNGVNLFALDWSTNLDGSIVTTNAYAYIGYTNSPNVADQISYSISDGYGGTNIGYVDIVIQISVGQASPPQGGGQVSSATGFAKFSTPLCHCRYRPAQRCQAGAGNVCRDQGR